MMTRRSTFIATPFADDSTYCHGWSGTARHASSAHKADDTSSAGMQEVGPRLSSSTTTVLSPVKQHRKTRARATCRTCRRSEVRTEIPGDSPGRVLRVIFFSGWPLIGWGSHLSR